MPFFHGIKVVEPVTGVRRLAAVATAIIGLVATAEDADAATFPLDRPVLVTDIRAVLDKAGTSGTLAPSLVAIAEQANAFCIVVRVAEGETDLETETNVIGSQVAGSFTGMQALLAAEGQLGVRPRILGAPGLDSELVTEALAIIAKKLRGFVYASCAGAATVAEAIVYRGNFDHRELMLIHPDWNRFNGHQVAAAMGLRAKIDQQEGWHKTLSNIAVTGITGMTADIGFDVLDSVNDAGLLNEKHVTTLVHMNGYRYWGNRTCAAAESPFAFESATRTAQVLQDKIAAGLVWALDKGIVGGVSRDIIETINADFREDIRNDRLIGASCWYDPASNPAAQLAQGKLVIDYDFTPVAPLEGLTLNQRITDRFYANFAAAA